MFTSIYIVEKLNAKDCPKVRAVSKLVQEAADLAGVHTLTEDDKPTHWFQFEMDRWIDHKTLVVAVGGDGTMLEAMRVAHSHCATAVGINLGKVGFLADFTPDKKLVQELCDILQSPFDKHDVEERMCLETFGEFDQFPQIAFNEIVISNKLSDQLIQYHLQIGNVDAGYHRGNSLILGTPTGSTAYTLSAGGGLMLPSMKAIQIVPVSPLSMTSRPIIVPADEDQEIIVAVETEGEWTLKCDGQVMKTAQSPGIVKVRACDVPVNVIHPKGWNFFNMLTKKLGWKSEV